jgi:hypothetical protein
VLLDERGERSFRLGADGQCDPRRYEVEDDDRRIVVPGDGVGVLQRQLGMRAAADGDEDPADLLGATLLDDRDVGEKTIGPLPLRPFVARPPQPKMMRSASCSADASMMPSAAWRPIRTSGWIVVPSGA